MKALDRLLSKARPQGPCFLCGHPVLARHRLWDAIDERQRIDRWGYPRIAREYPGVSAMEARDIRQAYDEARRQHRALPGRTA